MIKIGQKYKIVNYNNDLNGIIVKVIKYEYELYLCEIVDKSLLDNNKIKEYFHNDCNEYENQWYYWFNDYEIQPLRKFKLKRLLK